MGRKPARVTARLAMIVCAQLRQKPSGRGMRVRRHQTHVLVALTAGTFTCCPPENPGQP